MSRKQFFFKAVPDFPFVTAAIDCGIHMDVYVSLHAEVSGAPAILGPAKLSVSSVFVLSATRRTLHDHARPSTSAIEVVVNRSVKMNDNFSLFSYPCLIYCGGKTKPTSTLGKMRLSGYYT